MPGSSPAWTNCHCEGLGPMTLGQMPDGVDLDPVSSGQTMYEGCCGPSVPGTCSSRRALRWPRACTRLRLMAPWLLSRLDAGSGARSCIESMHVDAFCQFESPLGAQIQAAAARRAALAVARERASCRQQRDGWVALGLGRGFPRYSWNIGPGLMFQCSDLAVAARVCA